MTTMDKFSPLRPSSTSTVNPVSNPATSVVPLQRQNLAGDGRGQPPRERTAREDKSEKRKELKKAVQHISGYVQDINRELDFSMDEEGGRPVVTVIDGQSGEVIRRIPCEEILEISHGLSGMKEKTTKGILFKGDA